jgi:hypothetical protein
VAAFGTRTLARQADDGDSGASVLRRRARPDPDHEAFTSLKRLLLDSGVTIVMAGDTHDLGTAERSTAGAIVHHFVNGGGGAYSVSNVAGVARTLQPSSGPSTPIAKSSTRRSGRRRPGETAGVVVDAAVGRVAVQRGGLSAVSTTTSRPSSELRRVRVEPSAVASASFVWCMDRCAGATSPSPPVSGRRMPRRMPRWNGSSR